VVSTFEEDFDMDHFGEWFKKYYQEKLDTYDNSISTGKSPILDDLTVICLKLRQQAGIKLYKETGAISKEWHTELFLE